MSQQLAHKTRPKHSDHQATRRRPNQSSGSPISSLALRAPALQTKLEVNEPGDAFEREAETTADAVMRAPIPTAPPVDEPEAAPGVQRLAGPEEEAVQRQEQPNEEVVQRQEQSDEEAVQRQEQPDEEAVQRQTQPEDENLQRQVRPDEVEVQRQTLPDTEIVQRSGESKARVTPATAATIHNPGSGAPLSPTMRQRIEPQVGANLSGVRVHSGSSANRAADSLQARAFTHGNHIFLNRAESSNNTRLIAHESTHVVQQGAAPLQRQPQVSEAPEQIQRLPGFITSRLASYARHIPGYTLFTVIIGFNPLSGSSVERNATNLVEGLMGLVPFGTAIFDKLQELGILQQAFTWIEGQMARLDLSMSRVERLIEEAWDEMDFWRLDPFDYNLGVLSRKFGGLLNDVKSFARSLVDQVIRLIKEAAIGVAEGLLAGNKAWELIKMILHHDPLNDVPVEASTVEIVEAFLMLIGKEQELAQMRERGTLQETADWLDTQLGTFMGLLAQLRGLITAVWETIQPQNLPNLMSNLRSLATQAIGFLQGVWGFGSTVAVKVLALIKNALLGWLSGFAHEVPGFHLITVLLGRNPFTQEAVPRTPENIIKGFITLLPGGNGTYQQLQGSGAIGRAAGRIEGAIAELGISWEFILGLFSGIWNSLAITDLINPIGAFLRIRNQFGEPISRLFAFIRVVVTEIFMLILEMMNFPTDLIGSIITNAMQAYEDIKRDPIGFLKNMLRAVKLGFTNFFDNILQHLIGGLADWLFRGLRDAGIEPPTDLSLQSILNLVLQVLGISMDRIWEKLAERIGQETVDRIRGAIDRLVGIWNFIRDVQEQGIVAIWEYIESQISNLWNIILEKAQEWVMERIINRAIQWLLSLLDPTGIMPVINSFIAFFRAVQSAIEYLRDILAIINDYVTTVAEIARGAIEPGAQKLEQGLANVIPIAIGFLANQFGLGNIAEKVQEIIASIREVIDQALNWLIDRAVSMGEGILRTLGLGGEVEEEEGEARVEDTAIAVGVEAIPENLPPEEVKRRVLDMAQSQLRATDANSIQAVHGILQSIVATNRDRGLNGLSMRVVDQSSMMVRVEASASEPVGRRIAWSDIFGTSTLDTNAEIEDLREKLSKASQASYAAVVVDGSQIGSLSESGGGEHAEEALVRGSSWAQAIEAAREGVRTNGSSRVTLMINRTPCSSCVQWLTGAIGEAKSSLGSASDNVVFLLAATGTYRRQARMNEEDKAILKTGSERMAERMGRPFDDVFKEQEQIWKEDLRSFSTEWVDNDNEQYSGLSDLARAGWQIAGLDAGQPPTARQLELAQIAARLAEEFRWDS